MLQRSSAAVDPLPTSARALMIPVLLWAVVNVVAILGFGFRTYGDASIFVGAAEKLLAGTPWLPVERSYSGYIVLLAALERLHLGITSVFLVQFALSLLALWAVFGLATAMCDVRAGMIAALLCAINVDMQVWNLYLLTDSLYVSCVVITAFLISRPDRASTMSAVALSLVSATIRPTGWLLVPIVLSVIAVRYWRATATRAIAIAVIWAGFVGFMATSSMKDAIEYERPGEMLRNGVVIWGYPAGRVVMPHDERPLARNWVGDVSYVARHPLATMSLAIRRVGTELAHGRPFYSLRHNIGVAAWYGPLFLLAGIGAVRRRKAQATRIAAAIIGCHLALVAAMFADWDGRFLIHVVPLFTCLAAAGAVSLWDRVASQRAARSVVLISQQG
jgi:hypothetical protein